MSDLKRVEFDDGQQAVFLLPRLPYRVVAAIKYEVVQAREEAGGSLSSPEVLGILSEAYLLHGIASWTLDTKISREAIRTEILEHDERAMFLGEAADELYSEQVILPLLKLAGRSSPNGQTSESTSARNGSSPKPPKRSKRSSTTTTPTDDTETITPSLAGVSSS